MRSKKVNNLAYFLSTLFVLTSLASFAQVSNEELLIEYEDSIAVLAEQVVVLETDSLKYEANSKLLRCVEIALNLKNSYNHPFSSVERMSKQVSPDGKLKIYNWVLKKEDGSHEYFGFTQKKLRKKKYKVAKLTDKSDQITSPEKKMLNASNWYGSLYYKIVPVKKSGKRYYTLIGWDGNDPITKKKVIDVVYFNGKGDPRFGANIFLSRKKLSKRVIFEYASKSVMSVQYDEKYEAIIFDHLAPADPKGTPASSLKGMYEFYGPDGTYDAYVFEKGKWRLTETWDAKNQAKDEPKTKFIQPD